MRCPSCGVEIIATSGQSGRCTCGWDPAQERPRALRLLGLGILLDSAGSLLLVYLFLAGLAATPWIGGAAALIAGGVALIILAARKLSPIKRP